VLYFPVNDCGADPLEREHREDVPVGAFGVDLQEIEQPDGQVFENIIESDAIDGLFPDHRVQTRNEIAMLEKQFLGSAIVSSEAWLIVTKATDVTESNRLMNPFDDYSRR
jgi:hypothetical protein